MPRNTAPAFLLLLLAAPIAAPLARDGDLTFEERVAAQEAIERVYYSHQAGATQPFEIAVPRAVLEKKVRTSLRESAALQEYWKAPITAESLGRELDRMERNSRMPDRLREIQAALGNDRRLVLECLVRPALADRLARAFLERTRDQAAWWAAHEHELDAIPVEAIPAPAFPAAGGAAPRAPACSLGDVWDNGSLDTAPRGRWHHVSVWTGSEMIVWGGEYAGAGILDYRGTGGRYDPATDTWRPTSIENAPFPGDQEAIWTGAEMILWGDSSGRSGRYNPTTDTWSGISTMDAPPEDLNGHTMIWTGTRMIVWGGYQVSPNSGGVFLGTGAEYDPVTDLWHPISTTNAPTARSSHSAVWTGTEMVIWGGYDGVSALDTGGRYDPASDTWKAVSTTGAATARSGHTAVWTGAQMIVWGSFSDNNPGNAGGRYDPATDTWLSIAQHSSTELRSEYSVVWTGSEMIVWGGSNHVAGVGPLNTGYRYDPLTDVWTPTSTVNAPQGRRGHTAIWTGSRMIVWGGGSDAPLAELNSGGRYDPATDTWTPTYASSGPTERSGHTAVWTGNLMIVWGGQARDPSSGGRYDPATDTWTPTTLVGAPVGRVGHTAIWTGNQMVVWGGSTPPGPNPLNSGGRYDPIADAWSPTSTVGAPTARIAHSAVWDGSGMIVWGGGDYFTRVATGGRYDPATDSWTATSATGAPSERQYHSAFWTGTQMIVWGGADDSNGRATGARYDPVQDAWTPISTVDAPYSSDVGVWTGTRMILWGRGEPQFGVPAGIYDPAADTWSAISTDGAPPGTVAHTAIWTGTEMIIWGGAAATPGDLGGRYNPSTGHWSPITTAGAPLERTGHTAVWTGTEMIVWGGVTDRGDSGGRYIPYELGDPPTADAGIDRTEECSGPTGTAVALHAAGTGCGPLRFTWTGPFAEGGGTVAAVDATVTLLRVTSPITLRVDDSLGHSVTDTVLVSVVDSLAPVLDCPASVASECPAQPVLGHAGVTDLCDAAPHVNNGNAPATYPFGSTTVTFMATDASGNGASCQTVAAMVDTRPPVITVPSGITRNATTPAGVAVSFRASAADSCTGRLTATCAPRSGSSFPINPPGQSTAVVCQATDPHGNLGTATLQVHIKGAGEQMGDLAAVIAGLGLGPDWTEPLLAAIGEARDAATQGRSEEACEALNLVSRKSMRTRTEGGRRTKVPLAQLSPLLETIRRIRTVLACGGAAGP